MESTEETQAVTPAKIEVSDSDAQVIAVLLTKKAQLGSSLLDLEDQTSRMRRELTAITETLKVFGVAEPETPKLPPKVMRRRTKEGFRRGELCRRVLEKIRDSKEPAVPSEIGRAIMRECMLDAGDEKLYFAFQHKVHNVIRRQWQRGVLERVGGDDGFNARWKIADV